jgi:hypothetical protein
MAQAWGVKTVLTCGAVVTTESGMIIFALTMTRTLSVKKLFNVLNLKVSKVFQKYCFNEHKNGKVKINLIKLEETKLIFFINCQLYRCVSKIFQMETGVTGALSHLVALPAEMELKLGPDSATTQHLLLEEHLAPD